MPDLFKKLLIAFTIIIGLTIIVVQIMPKPKLSYSERRELLNQLFVFNAKLPLKVGTIGQLDRVVLEGDTLSYHFSNYGDRMIDAFYEANYDAVREVMMYGIIALNGRNNNGTKLTDWYDAKGIILKSVFKTPSSREFSWVYSGEELLDFIDKMKISPTKALYTIIDTNIKLANMSLPLNSYDANPIQSISNNAIKTSLSDGDRLLEIKHEDDNIIFVIETQEKEARIADIKPVAEELTFLDALMEEASEDPDMKEFIDMLALSHSNLVYSYHNVSRTDSVNIVVPYIILEDYSTINNH